MTTFTQQQGEAIKQVVAWAKDKTSSQRVFRLFGFAGTGKTTIARHIANQIGGTVLFAAYTGKAALVLQSKGCFGASTIHSLIYRPDLDIDTGKVTFKLNKDSPLSLANLLILDECSMVADDLAHDLLSFGKKVLVLGDPAQLPPVKGTGYFIDAAPDVMLTDIRRQEADNPIIRMSIDVRQGKPLKAGHYGTSSVISRSELTSNMVLDADQVLVGLNKTRRLYNNRVRQLKGIESPYPVPDDRLICLKNENDRGLLNGSMWSVHAAETSGCTVTAKLLSLDEVGRSMVEAAVLKEFFTADDAQIKQIDWRVRQMFSEFTYGYAITCHKSQGSTFDNVLIFDESRAFRQDAAKWLYTAITRAAESVVVVQS